MNIAIESIRWDNFWDANRADPNEGAAAVISMAVRHPEWARYWATVIEACSSPDTVELVHTILLKALPIPLTAVDA